jgi:hypothetical protein
MFGENKPLLGACHDGRLDLVYRRDPGLKEGTVPSVDDPVIQALPAIVIR